MKDKTCSDHREKLEDRSPDGDDPFGGSASFGFPVTIQPLHRL